MAERVKGNKGVPRFDPEFPKFVKVETHPDPTQHVWFVELTDGKTYSVAWGQLKDWMYQYAR